MTMFLLILPVEINGSSFMWPARWPQPEQIIPGEIQLVEEPMSRPSSSIVKSLPHVQSRNAWKESIERRANMVAAALEARRWRNTACKFCMNEHYLGYCGGQSHYKTMWNKLEKMGMTADYRWCTILQRSSKSIRWGNTGPLSSICFIMQIRKFIDRSIVMVQREPDSNCWPIECSFSDQLQESFPAQRLSGQTLHQAGRNSSFEEFNDVTHMSFGWSATARSSSSNSIVHGSGICLSLLPLPSNVWTSFDVFFQPKSKIDPGYVEEAVRDND